MDNLIRKIMLAAALMASAGMCSATTMVFDTVTAYTSAAPHQTSSITGIERDTGDIITANFGGYDHRAAPTVCTPSVITAMEKPGRYYLYVTWDPSHFADAVTSCMLELKNLPE